MTGLFFPKFCKHKKVDKIPDVRLDRRVLKHKCKNCSRVVFVEDVGKYNGVPRPRPSGGWEEER